MQIIYLDSVNSTHIYLKEYIKRNKYNQPLAVVTTYQTNGIGSRSNSWSGKKGNLFFSFVLAKDNLPKDLPIQSASIYFSFILKEILNSFSSSVWIKWPNDFYIDDKKIGGTITSFNGTLLFCGIGLNLYPVDNKFGYLDISIDIDQILKLYFSTLEQKISWKHIFSKYLIEFKKSRSFQVTIDEKKVSLKDAILNDDGSIQIKDKKVYSLR